MANAKWGDKSILNSWLQKSSTKIDSIWSDCRIKETTAMENEDTTNKDLKVEIPSEGGEATSPVATGLSRQGSMAKNNCLCSPTTHPGSFRCRLHRTPSFQRSKSIDSNSAPVQDPHPKF
ncbi:hypothetical protein RJ639_013346 [Escallonia herrerae]|uniref:Uncharacterized protein n=1 Tax=Escallonia herrerae TaxID=1293975 RepID=A0AA88VHE9_9ASTE|nr:hypothetical protein RJ639_013346 [Escallonia herrerae]